jgi:GT2 family glycosyltransferase
MVTAAIVLYKNDEVILTKAIQSFLKSSNRGTLFLIDNSPTNDLKKLSIDKDVVYVHNPSNPGFGAAHNIAIEKARELGSHFHLVLNPDIYFGKEVISKLEVYMTENNAIGNLMPKVLYPKGGLQYLCKLLPTPYDWIGRRFNPFKELTERRNEIFELRFTKYNQVMEVPYLSGCFMFLRMSSLKKIGLFDEKIFMYGEETDLCRRLIMGGYKTVFFPEVEIYHHFEKGSHKSWRLTKIGIQSAIYYFNKWGWFFDKERREINKDTLTKLGYTK